MCIGPHPEWFEPKRIVSLHPWGHIPQEVFAKEIGEGLDIRPSIAVTRVRLKLPEIISAMAARRPKSDGAILKDNGDIAVTKMAIEPVWHLPGVAERFGASESDLRRTLFEETGGMYPELVTRPDLKVFMPPIGGGGHDPHARHPRNAPRQGCRHQAGFNARDPRA